jgi:phosphoribosylamine---glycine ligase
MAARSVMPTRILVVGNGAREHALAWKLAAEPGVNEVMVAPGSDAIGLESRVRCEPVEIADVPGLVSLARRRAVELAVIGPEVSLAWGVVDALVGAGVPTFGPTEAAARIETSKGFCREIAEAAGVRMAAGALFSDVAGAIEAARRFAEGPGRGVVVKQDGLAAGKGVRVCDTAGEAEAAILDMVGDTHSPVIVEERLRGAEASVIALCDGHEALPLPASRDHKQLLDGDAGPNTGGMGAYSPLPDLPPELVEEVLATVHRPILAELARRGTPFVGFLYAGMMLTDAGPTLLECNARLGDPEAQVLLPRLAVALGPVMAAAARGDLGSAPGTVAGSVPWLPFATVGIVLASAGYPGTPTVGQPIRGLEAASEGALVFHGSSTRLTGGGYQTNGGRVLTVVGRGPDLPRARDAAEAAASLISWEGMQRRHDIAATLPPEPAVAGAAR